MYLNVTMLKAKSKINLIVEKTRYNINQSKKINSLKKKSKYLLSELSVFSGM